jgi:3-oxoacyl-[acyl-carrier protein] reductase
MKQFEGKVVIVTGSARGLGRDYARYFAEDGASVVLADVKDMESATSHAAETGAKTMSVEVDITSRESVEALVVKTMAAFGRIDILVNNAGLWRGLSQAGLLGCSEEAWRAAWEVNVTGAWLCYKAVVPHMQARGSGRIINISSVAASNNSNAYGLTKSAVELMTAGMAREVGAMGITVNCISPGISAFEGAKGALANADAIIATQAIKRLGTSRELYAAIRYFCSQEAAWVTGETLGIDGGARTR